MALLYIWALKTSSGNVIGSLYFVKISRKPLQSLNAPFPILVTEIGIVIVDIPAHLLNA